MHTIQNRKGKLYLDGKLIAEDIATSNDDELKDILSKATVIVNNDELEDLIENFVPSKYIFSEGLNRSSRRHHANYEVTRYKRPKKNSKNYF